MEEYLDDQAGKMIYDVFKTAAKELGRFVKGKSKELDPLKLAAKKYGKKMRDRYDVIKVMGMSQPMKLKDLYVKVYILEKLTTQLGHNVEDLEKFYQRDLRKLEDEREPLPIPQIINKYNKFIVLGKPGAGKTTLLKYLALLNIDNSSLVKVKRIPIFVTLKQYSESGLELLDYIVDQFDICNISDAKPFIERILEHGKCQILLDGLDEVMQDNVDRTIQYIIDFSDKYSENQFVISCRIAAYNHWFEHFTDVEISDFNDEQIELFIKNWFKKEIGVYEECWNKLKDNVPLKELASTPLLLTLLCIAYDENNDFPPNRAQVYKEATEALLKKWDATRRIKRDQLYKELSYPQKEIMLSQIAYHTFQEGHFFMYEEILLTQLKNYLVNLPEIKETELDPESKAVLKSIEAQHGIIIQRARGGIYSFSHLTLQEYFTAKYIVDQRYEGTLDELVNQYLFDDQWREVILLVAGMLPKGDVLIKNINAKTNEIAGSDKFIQKLLKAVRAFEYTPFEGEIFSRMHIESFIIWRALARIRTHNRVRVRTLARTLTRALALTLTLDRARALTLDLDLARALTRDRALDRALDRAIDRAIDLDSVDKLNNYLHAKTILIQCIQNSLHLTKAVRENILNNFFVLPEELE